jgi:hypothetical protein
LGSGLLVGCVSAVLLFINSDDGDVIYTLIFCLDEEIQSSQIPVDKILSIILWQGVIFVDNFPVCLKLMKQLILIGLCIMEESFATIDVIVFCIYIFFFFLSFHSNKGTIDHCGRGARAKKAHPLYIHTFIQIKSREVCPSECIIFSLL